MVNHFLPGLRCLHADMEQLSPEHEVKRSAPGADRKCTGRDTRPAAHEPDRRPLRGVSDKDRRSGSARQPHVRGPLVTHSRSPAACQRFPSGTNSHMTATNPDAVSSEANGRAQGQFKFQFKSRANFQSDVGRVRICAVPSFHATCRLVPRSPQVILSSMIKECEIKVENRGMADAQG